jgi:hypothetical protein
MMTWVRLVGGVLLVALGVLWSLQGSGALGGSGGMNGQSQWLVIGVIVAIAGVILIVGSARKLRAGPRG